MYYIKEKVILTKKLMFRRLLFNPIIIHIIRHLTAVHIFGSLASSFSQNIFKHHHSIAFFRVCNSSFFAVSFQIYINREEFFELNLINLRCSRSFAHGLAQRLFLSVGETVDARLEYLLIHLQI